MNSDLISRKALLGRLDKVAMPDDLYGLGVQCGVEHAKKVIAEAPAVDAVEVVRCKDCVYWKRAKVNRKGFLICPASGMEIMARDFCSYGERRADDAD